MLWICDLPHFLLLIVCLDCICYCVICYIWWLMRRDPGESLVPDITSLQSPVPAVTRPTHFNFYLSGALVTYNDITPDLPQAAWSIRLCVVLSLATLLWHWPLIGWWVPVVAFWLHVTGSRCHLASESQISTVMLELYSRQIYTVRMVIIPVDSGQICHHLHMMTALWSGDVPRQARRHPAACHSQMYHR